MDEPVVFGYGACVRCGQPFVFDPETVPSTAVHPETRCPFRPDGTPVKPADPDAVREQLCVACAGLFRAAGGADRPVTELFPRARFDLIDVDAALRIQAGGTS